MLSLIQRKHEQLHSTEPDEALQLIAEENQQCPSNKLTATQKLARLSSEISLKSAYFIVKGLLIIILKNLSTKELFLKIINFFLYVEPLN